MKRKTLLTFVVLMLISIDLTISVSYADKKITIFKITKVTPGNTLKLRAWPSPKSRIKVSLPYNAKDLTETGKQRIINKAKWVEVNWNQNRGWVNGHYLKKTGVLLRPSTPNKIASRNSNANKVTVAKIKKKSNKVITEPARSLNDRPQEYSGDRYDQSLQVAATEVKMAYSAHDDNLKNKLLNCRGNTPQPWNIVIDVAKRSMLVEQANTKGINVPINYHAWSTPNRVRMNIGGNKGRNVVDVNLEKTNSCSNGYSKTNFPYRVNATINRNFVSGCCQVAN